MKAFKIAALVFISLTIVLCIWWRPVRMPHSWPVNYVRVPCLSTRAVTPFIPMSESKDGGYTTSKTFLDREVEYYGVGFRSLYTWNRIIEYYDEVLLRRGYTVKSCSTKKPLYDRRYESKDEKYYVDILYNHDDGVYYLQVYVYNSILDS